MKKFVSNSAWMVGDNLVSRLVGFIVVVFVARYLGPDNYGMYAYVMSMAALFGMIGHMGLDGIVVRELVSRPEIHGETLGTASVLKLGGYGLGAAILIGFGIAMPAHLTEERWLFALAAIGVIIQAVNSVLANWFRAHLQARYAVMSNLSAVLSAAALKLGLVVVGAGIVAVGGAQSTGALLGAALIIWLFLRHGGPPFRKWSFSSARARVLLSEGWMIFAGSFFAVIYLKIDLVMLRIIQGPESVGVYSIAALISEAAYFIPVAIVASVFPRLVEINAEDPVAFSERLQRLFDFLSLSGWIVLFMLLAGGPMLVATAMGPAFAGSIPVLLIHVFALPFIFLRQAFSPWILIQKLAQFSMLSQGAGAIFNIILNLALIPAYGPTGAAIATVCSYATAGYLILLFFKETRQVFCMMSLSLFQPWRGAKEVNVILSKLRHN